MEPLGHRAIRSFHLGDLREDGAFPVRTPRLRLQLAGALLHRSPFLAVNPLDAMPLTAAPLAAFCVPFLVDFLSAIAKYLRASNESQLLALRCGHAAAAIAFSINS
jgi:hypothetical protein